MHQTIQKNTEKQFYTPSEVAETLQLNKTTIYNYIKAKKLTAIRIGKEYRIEKKDFDAFIENNKI